MEIYADETSTSEIASGTPSPTRLLQFQTAAEIVSSPAFQEIANSPLGLILQNKSLAEPTTADHSSSARATSPIKRHKENFDTMILYGSHKTQNSPVPVHTPSPSLRQRLSKYGQLHTPRSIGKDQGKYIYFLEYRIVELENKLRSSLSPASTRAQRLQIKDLGAETQELQAEVNSWRGKHDAELEEKIKQHRASERKLCGEIRSLENACEEKQARIEHLEKEVNQTDRREKEIERLQAHNIDLGRRVDTLAELLAQSSYFTSSPVKEGFNQPINGPRSRMSERLSSVRRLSLLDQEGNHGSDHPFVGSRGHQTHESRSSDEQANIRESSCARNVTPKSQTSSASTDVGSTKVVNPFHLPVPISDPEGDEHTSITRSRRTRKFLPGSIKPKPLILGHALSASSSPTRLDFDHPPAYYEIAGSPSRSSLHTAQTIVRNEGPAFLQPFDFEHPRSASTETRLSHNERLSPISIAYGTPRLYASVSGTRQQTGSDEGTPRAEPGRTPLRPHSYSLFQELDGLSHFGGSSPAPWQFKPSESQGSSLCVSAMSSPAKCLQLSPVAGSSPEPHPQQSLSRSQSPLRAYTGVNDEPVIDYGTIKPRTANRRFSWQTNDDTLVADRQDATAVVHQGESSESLTSTIERLRIASLSLNDANLPVFSPDPDPEQDATSYLIGLPPVNVMERKGLISTLWTFIVKGWYEPTHLARSAARLALKRAEDLDNILGYMAWRLISRAVGYRRDSPLPSTSSRGVRSHDLEAGSMEGALDEDDDEHALDGCGETEALLRRQEDRLERVRTGFVGYILERLGLWVRLELTLVILIVVALRKGPEKVLEQGRNLIEREEREQEMEQEVGGAR